MTEAAARHRLDGLEPDNLLAFLALLGLLRALESSRPEWRPRAAWDIDTPPLRPVLSISAAVNQQVICEAAATGVSKLLAALDFANIGELKIESRAARDLLSRAGSEWHRPEARFFADLCAALVSDVALDRDQEKVEPAPFAYPKVARVNFLAGLKAVCETELPERKSRTRDANYPQTPADCIAQAVFHQWRRLDRPTGLRWDPDEAKRHAYQWNAPTDEAPTTQHGANRLAVVGLSLLTAVPASSGTRVRLSVIGGAEDRDGFSFAWPIWTAPTSLAGVRALLSHPKLRVPGALADLGVDHVRVARRISLDRYRNFAAAAIL